MNTAIIVAAGTGSRFDSETPKQFLEILGKPLIGHTLDRFERCEAIGEIVLVLAENQIAAFERLDLRKAWSKLSNVVPGGRTRAESVSNGLAAVRDSVEVVAVHDGAR